MWYVLLFVDKDASELQEFIEMQSAGKENSFRYMSERPANVKTVLIESGLKVLRHRAGSPACGVWLREKKRESSYI